MKLKFQEKGNTFSSHIFAVSLFLHKTSTTYTLCLSFRISGVTSQTSYREYDNERTIEGSGIYIPAILTHTPAKITRHLGIKIHWKSPKMHRILTRAGVKQFENQWNDNGEYQTISEWLYIQALRLGKKDPVLKIHFHTLWVVEGEGGPLTCSDQSQHSAKRVTRSC